MNILIVAVGSAGDVHPFVGIGRALVERGHRVTILTSCYFESLVRRAGLEFGSIGTLEDFQRMLANPHVWEPVRGVFEIFRTGVAPAVRLVYEAVVSRHVPGETVVVASSLGIGARIAQERFDIPTATVHLSPSVFRGLDEPPVIAGMLQGRWVPKSLTSFQFWLADTLVIDRLLGAEVNGLRRELGLPPVRRIFHDWFHSPQMVLGLFPEWFARPQRGWPANLTLAGFPRYDERDVTPPSAAAQEFVDSGEPPIVFTPGSAMMFGHDFFRASVEACQRLGRRGVLLTRFPEQIPADLPAGVRHFDFVPLSWLLPRSAALVFHGGIGTMSQALAAGVPQLVMAMGFDQPDNAARVARLGVGASIARKNYQPARVARALGDLLESPQVASNCREIARRFENDAPLDAACAAIERLAGSEARSGARSLVRPETARP